MRYDDTRRNEFEPTLHIQPIHESRDHYVGRSLVDRSVVVSKQHFALLVE